MEKRKVARNKGAGNKAKREGQSPKLDERKRNQQHQKELLDTYSMEEIALNRMKKCFRVLRLRINQPSATTKMEVTL